VDNNTVVFVADPGLGNILNFSVGGNLDLAGKWGWLPGFSECLPAHSVYPGFLNVCPYCTPVLIILLRLLRIILPGFISFLSTSTLPPSPTRSPLRILFTANIASIASPPLPPGDPPQLLDAPGEQVRHQVLLAGERRGGEQPNPKP
jgi:hypothetical protein